MAEALLRLLALANLYLAARLPAWTKWPETAALGFSPNERK